MVRLFDRLRKVRPQAKRSRLRLTSLEGRAVPATLVVNALTDSGSGSGLSGDLRYCINTATAGDVINFSNTLFATPQTISVGSQLSVAASISIAGPGFDGSGNPLVTIQNVASAGANSRVLSIASALNVTLAGVTITGGNVNSFGYGGGILSNAASLTIDNCVITGNVANSGGGLAIYDLNTSLVITNSTISGNSTTGLFFANGGGMYLAQGTNLTLTGSTISGNAAVDNGGGIYFFQDGQFTIANSTLSGNTAGSQGGAMYFYRNTTGPSVVRNSTVTGNSAGAGGGFYFSNLSQFSGTVTLSSSIVAGNAGLDPDLSFTSPAVIAGGDNLVGVADVGNFTLSGTNITGTVSTPESAMLGSLAKNGGLTRTHALLPGSKAIDAGNNIAGLTTDQRGPGNPRVQGLKADIGSYETTSGIPSASFVPLATIVTPGATPNTVQVTFLDDSAINVGTIAASNIEITAPDNSKLAVTAASASPNSNGSPITATYTFTPPGGAWSAKAYGTYTVSILANQVSDTGASFVPAGTLGTFKVAIAQTFLVDSAPDIDDGNYGVGQLSLREAIKLANQFSGTADTITFAPALTKISLAGTELEITDPVTMTGPGAGNLEINGGGMSRILRIDVPGGGGNAVAISGLALTNGKVSGNGAAILNVDEALTLTTVELSANTATGSGGAVATTAAQASLSIIDSRVTGNASMIGFGGGGIFIGAGSKVSLLRSTVSGNVSDSAGGGIYGFNSAVLSITDSTLSGNSAAGAGGAVAMFAGTLTVSNSTVSGNSAAVGGGFRLTSNVAASIANSTVAYNAATAADGVGGISVLGNSSVITLSSTILAKNSGLLASDLGLPPGMTVFGGNNLIGVYDKGDYQLAGTNKAGSRANPLDPLLAPLANSGGTTLTHGLVVGSPAIDAGTANGLSYDQRGMPFFRVQNGITDIGAFEGIITGPVAYLDPIAAVTSPSSTTSTVTVRYVDDTAIDASTFSIANVVITGPGATSVPVTAFSVDVPGNGSPRTVTYTFSIPGGAWDPADNGNYVVSQLAGAVTDVSAIGVTARTLGSFTVSVGSVFVVDEATDIDDGDVSAGKLSIREAVRLSNTTNPGVADSITFDPVVFSGVKTIALPGGALDVTDPVYITGTGVTKLTLDGNGTGRVFNIALFLPGGSVVLSDMKLTGGNVSNGSGGAIFNDNALLTVKSSTITGNTITSLTQSVGGAGIALFNNTAGLLLIDSTVSNNVAAGNQARGGGIHVAGDSVVAIQRSTVSGNQAGEDGGGIYFVFGGNLSLTDSTLSGNKSNITAAGAGGAGVYLFGTRAVVRNSTITGNQANSGAAPSPGGGFVVRNNSALALQNSTVVFNSGTAGGGIEIDGSAVRMESTIVAGNSGGANADIAGSLVGLNSLIQNTTGLTLLAGSGSNVTGVDPLLNSLANNGGPTPTHALKAGSPALNVGSNPAGLSFDQRGAGFARQSGAGVDIGAYELVAANAAKVVGLGINGGASQRSRVTTVEVVFDQIVTLPGDLNTAFQVKRLSDNAVVTINSATSIVDNSGSGTKVTLKWTGSTAVDGAAGNRSLADGRYVLTGFSSAIGSPGGALDGDGNGSPGSDYVSPTAPFIAPATPPVGIFRLYGDTDGSGKVDSTDFLAFRLAFLSSQDALDADGNGSVDSGDLLRFRLNFLMQVA
ncbi:MAG: right-handed parallel beta-helix repeat-containing protein [Gemmataceae bacterium]|nr:right-handed parallel beta-helix repeat-containing protein [Gemmataceae bacterium]